MEELQLLLKGKLYELSREKLMAVISCLKMKKAGSDETRRKTIQRIQMEIEIQTAGEGGEAFLLGLQKVMVEDIPPLEGDDNDEEEDANANLLQAAKAEFENMQKAFQEMLRLQEKKMKEAEDKFLSLRGKPAALTGTGSTIASPNIIRIKDFKIAGTITNEKNRLPYFSLNKQIESALQKGYSEADIVDGVINSVAPNLHLRS